MSGKKVYWTGTTSTLVLIILSFLAFAPVYNWLLDFITNLTPYLIIANLTAIIFLLYGRIKYKNKYYFYLASILFLFVIFFSLKLTKFVFYPNQIASFPNAQNVKIYYLNVNDDVIDNSRVQRQVEEYSPDLLLFVGFIDVEKNKSILAKYPHQISTADISVYSKLKFLELKEISDWTDRPVYIYQEVALANNKKFNLLLWKANQQLNRKNFYINKTYCRRLATLFRNSNEPRIVFGDFNATPFSVCYNWFARGSNLQHALWGKGARLGLIKDHIFHSEIFITKDVKFLDTASFQRNSILVDLSI